MKSTVISHSSKLLQKVSHTTRLKCRVFTACLFNSRDSTHFWSACIYKYNQHMQDRKQRHTNTWSIGCIILEKRSVKYGRIYKWVNTWNHTPFKTFDGFVHIVLLKYIQLAEFNIWNKCTLTNLFGFGIIVPNL